jgi:hypothetical protein
MAKIIQFQERSRSARESLNNERHAKRRQAIAWGATIAIISGALGYCVGRQIKTTT